VQRSRDAWPTALEEARKTLVQAENELAAVEVQARQMLARARRQVEQALEQVLRLEADRRTIEGETDV
jgi:hypothetical protein